MFGWGKKEEKKPPNPRRKQDLSNFGLFDIPDDFSQIGAGGGDDSGDDADLEAELAALTTGPAARKPKKKPPPPTVDLDSMVAASMRDIPSDEEIDSADENDPDLLAELGGLVGDEEEEEEEAAPEPPKPTIKPSPAVPPRPSAPSSSGGGLVGMLEERIEMYKKAESTAKQSGELARARRFNRGLKTLIDQLKMAKAGRPVPEEEIPPAVSASAASKPAQPAAPPSVEVTEPSDDQKPPPMQVPLQPIRSPPPPPSAPVVAAPAIPTITPAPVEEENETLVELQRRQLLYKQAALMAKKTGDNETAVKYLRVSKQFDSVIAAVKSGNPVDLSEMPEPPSSGQDSAPVVLPPVVIPTPPREAEKQGSGDAARGEPEAMPEPLANPKAPNLPPELLEPPAPTSIADALSQRLERFIAEEKLAKESGNSSKARRMGRIVKQYQDAIKMHKAGKPIPIEELPTPPGYAPIPVPGAPPAAAAPPSPLPPARSPARPPVEEPEEDSSPPKISKPSPPAPAASPKPQVPIAPVRKSQQQTRQEKQIALLIAKQKEFKEAAIAAKKRGDIPEARELLRQAKGFDTMLQASESGLPVDLTTLPILPQLTANLDSDFEYISTTDCTPGESTEIFQKLEEDLTKQLKLCLATRDHYKATGDVGGANKFEHLAVQTKRDFNMVKACHLRGEKLPRFRYENRAFQILQCNTDLGENDLELVIVQGISYTVPNPKEIDTYVKYEFPFPPETPIKNKTTLIYNTNNPQYNQNFTLAIARNSRPCQRVFKRHAVKLEVWAKGGFFSSDTLVGTVLVKLTPLETKCTIHESFPLMDGRKAVGGQLEVKVRLRHPIVTRQVEQRQERWIVVAPDDK